MHAHAVDVWRETGQACANVRCAHLQRTECGPFHLPKPPPTIQLTLLPAGRPAAMLRPKRWSWSCCGWRHCMRCSTCRVPCRRPSSEWHVEVGWHSSAQSGRACQPFDTPVLSWRCLTDLRASWQRKWSLCVLTSLPSSLFLLLCHRSYLQRHRPLTKYTASASVQQKLLERAGRYAAQGGAVNLTTSAPSRDPRAAAAGALPSQLGLT